MKPYVLSLLAGVLAGIVYGVVDVSSPAPPIIALIGLLGILVGEQIPPTLRVCWHKAPFVRLWSDHIKPHVFGHLPGGKRPPTPMAPPS